MPTYEFACHTCEKIVEHYQSIHDDEVLRVCPECGECNPDLFYKIVSCPLMLIDKTPKTVGSFAEQNTKKVGRYKIDEFNEHVEQRRKVAKKKLPKGAKPIDRIDGFTPWFRSGKVEGLPLRDQLKEDDLKKITSSKESEEKFINTGKI